MNYEFQTKLSKDIKKNRNTKKVLNDAYKSPRSKINRINIKAKNIVTKLGIEDRVEQLSEWNLYITVKDHKEEFPEKLLFRLINPSKSEIGNISKIILGKVNKVVIESAKLNQRKKTDIVIEWFKSIKNKDIESFYPSRSAELFNKA